MTTLLFTLALVVMSVAIIEILHGEEREFSNVYPRPYTGWRSRCSG